jgi:hypothetical protein
MTTERETTKITTGNCWSKPVPLAATVEPRADPLLLEQACRLLFGLRGTLPA